MRVVLVMMSLATLACHAPESANPAPRCTADGECSGKAHCYRGFCVPDEPPEADGGALCESGKTRCDEKCVDTLSDEKHCGGCALSCGEDQDCIAGRCEEHDS